MIYELTIQPQVSPHAWQNWVIHLPNNATFKDITTIIQTIYHIDANKYYQYFIKRSHGFIRNDVKIVQENDVIYYSEAWSHYDETTEIISKWLVQANDYALFSNENVSIVITLQKRLTRNNSDYPVCLQQEEINQQNREMYPLTMNRDTQKMTNKLQQNTYAFSAKEPLSNEWPTLLDLAKQFYLLNDCPIIRQDPLTFSVLDKARNEYFICMVKSDPAASISLTVYEGIEGYATFMELSKGNVHAMDDSLMMRGMKLEYVEQVELAQIESNFLLTYDSSMFASEMWPIFTSYKPGQGKWTLSASEISTFVTCIKETLYVYEFVKLGNKLPDVFADHQIYVREINENEHVTSAVYQLEDVIFRNIQAKLYISEFALKRLEKLSLRFNEKVEFSITHLDLPMRNFPWERPQYPMVTLTYVYSREEVMMNNLATGSLTTAYAQEQFIAMLHELQFVPKTIYLDELMLLHVLPLVNQLAIMHPQIEFRIVVTLPILATVQESLTYAVNLGEEE